MHEACLHEACLYEAWSTFVRVFPRASGDIVAGHRRSAVGKAINRDKALDAGPLQQTVESMRNLLQEMLDPNQLASDLKRHGAGEQELPA